MKSPTVSTLKTLFALSRNQCAFPKCTSRLVEEPSGTLVGKVCHINGKRNGPGSKRYDKNQTDEERHGIGNLIALCPKHHDVIDDDEEAYTVERLLKMKADHEARMREEPAASNSLAEKFAVAIYNNTITGGSIIHIRNETGGQSSGQIAHVIHNNYGSAPQPQSAFHTELTRRHLGDVDDPEFSRTPYNVIGRLGTGHEWAR